MYFCICLTYLGRSRRTASPAGKWQRTITRQAETQLSTDLSIPGLGTRQPVPGQVMVMVDDVVVFVVVVVAVVVDDDDDG